jgi:hypothetical protein
MPRERDYHAEYLQRLQRLRAQGFSLSQARGHPRRHETPVSKRPTPSLFDRRLESGVKEIRRGTPLTKAAKSITVAPERLRRYVKQTGVATKAGRQWRIGPDQRKREMPIFSEGQFHVITVRNFADASHVGRYMSAVNQFLDSQDESFVEQFIGDSVVDVRGRRYYFETRPNVLYRLNASQTEIFEEVYRIVT